VQGVTHFVTPASHAPTRRVRAATHVRLGLSATPADGRSAAPVRSVPRWGARSVKNAETTHSGAMPGRRAVAHAPPDSARLAARPPPALRARRAPRATTATATPWRCRVPLGRLTQASSSPPCRAAWRAAKTRTIRPPGPPLAAPVLQGRIRVAAQRTARDALPAIPARPAAAATGVPPQIRARRGVIPVEAATRARNAVQIVLTLTPWAKGVARHAFPAPSHPVDRRRRG